MSKKETTIGYGLRVKKTGKLAQYSMSSNYGRDFCGEYSYEIGEYGGDEDWLVGDAETAEYVRNVSTNWYNASYETPTNCYDPDELEVVEVKRIVEETPVTVEIPSLRQFFVVKYFEKERTHLDYLLELLETGAGGLSYGLWDIKIMMAEVPDWKEKYEKFNNILKEEEA